MQRTTVVAVLVTAVVSAVAGYLAGSNASKVSLVKHPHEARNCKGNDCDVTIKFACVDSAHPSPSTCEPYGSPELIAVDTGHKIKFTIDSSTTYTFEAGDGIKFASNFFRCSPQGGNKKYDCDISIPAGTPPGFYKYSVHVKDFDVVDPWVVNY